VNPATVRGAALVTAGVIMLALPTASAFITALVGAIALIMIGISDLWAESTAPDWSWRGLVMGVALIVAGVAMIVFTTETLTVLADVIAIVVAIRGAVTAWTGMARRKTNPSWLFDTVRGLFFIALGGIILFIPESLIAALLLIGALAVIIFGAVLIAYGVANPHETEFRANEVGGLVKRWSDQRDLGEEQRDKLVEDLYFEQPDSGGKQRGFWTLLVLSVVIATLGVLADSTAVVIGAMLVAPLMTPIMGFAAAIVNGWMHRLGTSFATVVGGVTVAIGAAWIVAVWTPQLVPIATNSQILSRTSPTMIDLMIAVAAGAAGAYATVDKRVSSSITGVAIAVALVPPLAIVGVMLQASEFADAWGAFLLFLTNFVVIVLVACFVFLVTGLAPMRDLRVNREKSKTVVVTVGLAALVILVPLAFTSQGILASATSQSAGQRVAESWLSDQPGLEVMRISVEGEDVAVRISGEGTLPSIEDLEVQLEEELESNVTVLVEYFPSVIVFSDSQ
jgi:uncharacterized hydrophobic protein (TIGR00271 family)